MKRFIDMSVGAYLYWHTMYILYEISLSLPTSLSESYPSYTTEKQQMSLWSCDVTFIFYCTQVTWLASSRSEAQARVCLPVRGAPWWVLLQHYSVAIIFYRRVWYRALSRRYACIWSSGIILIPYRLLLCQISFFAASLLS